MKKLALAALAVVIAASLTACGTPPNSNASGEPVQPREVGPGWGTADKLYVETITLPDGRDVTCVVLENSAENLSYGGVSCDWDSANNLVPSGER